MQIHRSKVPFSEDIFSEKGTLERCICMSAGNESRMFLLLMRKK
jgi:hypothetical protein